jgi:putative methyltransferase (TIGR04325 family)
MADKALAPLHRLAARVSRLPVMHGMLRRRFDRMFHENRSSNMFRGVFATYGEALAAAPKNRPTGYDNNDAANMYDERARRIHATDYPVMFWLQGLFQRGARSIFEIGGHVGLSYYAYQAHLPFPEGLSWCVHDVPAVMRRGRELAAVRDTHRRLSFSDRFEQTSGCDIFLAQGVLQYLPDTLADRLAALPAPPAHLLINLTPLGDKPSYFTVQSIGTAYCPYRIADDGEFVASLERLGYRVVDRWKNAEHRCDIAFHPSHSVEGYHGMYLRREA